MAERFQFTELKEQQSTGGESDSSSSTANRPEGFGQSLPEGELQRTEGTPLRERIAAQEAERAKGLRSIIVTFALVSAGVTFALIVQLIAGTRSTNPHGGVSSCSSECTELGIRILKRGGSAVDAAITTELCVGLLYPQYAGLGGGGFMLIHDHKTHQSTLLDFRETAPQGLTKEKLQGNYDLLRTGGLAVGVPGDIAGLYKAHKMYGKLSWAALFQPVIDLAKDGFQIPQETVETLSRRTKDLEEFQSQNPGMYALFQAHFMGQNPGDVVTRQSLAQVLKKIANEGPEAFYDGDIARSIVNTVQTNGGVLTLEDLKNYQVEEREPINITVRGHIVQTFPAPSSGPVMLRMLRDLDSHLQARQDSQGGEPLKITEETLPEYYKTVAKVYNEAFPCRALLGDPTEIGVAVNQYNILDSEKSTESVCKGGEAVPSKGTSHINVIDPNELMVSFTSSMNWWFGSLLVTQEGILLNDQMADFNQGSEVNDVGGGKRPLSGMTPTIVYNHDRPCKDRLAIGGINGSKIFGGVGEVLANYLLFSADFQKAVQNPRIWCDGEKCLLDQSVKNANELADGLGQSGLPTELVDWKGAVIGAVLKTNNTVVAVTDQHKDWAGQTY